jgi:hypothetical protein
MNALLSKRAGTSRPVGEDIFAQKRDDSNASESLAVSYVSVANNQK